MDVKIEAAPMVAEVAMIVAVVKAVRTFVNKVVSLVQRVASSSCPTLGSHSLSAVAPDNYILGGTA